MSIDLDAYEIDHGPLAHQQQKFFEELDELDAEEYAYFLSYGELPTAFDR